MTALINFFIRLRNLVVAEVPFVLGIVLAAVNTAIDRSLRGYAVAVGIALLHFVVSPAFEQAALKAKVVDPKLVEAVKNAMLARDLAATALAAPEPGAPQDGVTAPPA